MGIAGPLMAAKPGWKTNYDVSLLGAKSANKLVLLDFTGSDWCGWCVKLDDEVFSTSAFKSLAAQSLVLVELDFPQRTQLAASTVAQNEKLRDKYRVEGFPTVILVNASGREMKRWVGFNPNMLTELKAAVAKAGGGAGTYVDEESLWASPLNKILAGVFVVFILMLFFVGKGKRG